MDVPEEEQAQVAKRQAIQAIMRDTSLTPQEKQQKIQQFMATGGQGAPAPAPASTPAPAPEPSPQAAPSAPNKQALMSAVMRDTSLTPQEKQKKIQEIMAGGTVAAPTPAPEPAPVPAPAAEPAPPVSKQTLMAAVMKDTTLTPQQKQLKIQDIMKGGTGGVAATAPSDTMPLAPAGPPTAAASRPAGVGAVASSGGVDPAARKGGRASSAMTPAAAAATRAGESNEPAPLPGGVGAMASSGADPAARKGARVSSRVGSGGASTTSRDDDTASVEPAAMAPPGVGAVSSSGVDPAARKGARGSARTATASRSYASGGASVASSDASSVGAASSSRQEDPAARKAARESNRAARATAAAATAQLEADDHRVSQKVEEGSVDVPSHRVSTANAPQKSDVAYGTASAAVGAESHGGSSALNNLESEFRGKTATMAPVPAPQPDMGFRADVGTVAPMSTVPEEDRRNDQNESRYIGSSSPGMNQPETYAGLGLVGTDIVGAETGGFEAYVAGADEEEVVGALEVVTDAAIEEEDKKKQSRLLRIGGGVFCCLLIAIVVPVAVVVPGGDPGGVVNITESPSMAPSAPPTGATFAELLNALEPLYPSKEAFEEAFSDYDTPQYKAADWATNVAPLQLSGSDPRMISRYALATFYYATEGDDWERCGVGSTNCDTGREWLTAENECDWLAISCEDPSGGDYTVVELFFPPTGPFGNNVAGTLPFEVALLTGLGRIVLSKQKLSGSIPETWTGLTNLNTLIIGTNELTGTFPDFLLQNTLLGSLYVSSNKLSGLLPPLSSASVVDLRFDYNNITGPIPSEFGNLVSLRELYADNNDLTGELPEELFSLTAMRSLRVSNNTGLSGTLSESIGNLKGLQQLRAVNTGMGGPLPSGLFDLIELQVLEISVNSFSGTLSSDFSRLANVTQITLSNNTFTGPIPDVFQNLQFLRTLELHANDLTGSVSAGLCNRTGDGFFDINYLTADCAGDAPEVSCSCCDVCY